MSREQTITGVMLTDHEARIAVIETVTPSGKMILKVLARITLAPDAAIDGRLSALDEKLAALGCNRHSRMWVACSLPEMSFASVTVERTDIDTAGPVAWLKFKKEVENLPDRVVFDFELPEQETDGVVPMWEMPCFAAPYDELAEIESWFAARFKLQGITMDMFSCRNLLAMANISGDETTALLSCEKNFSRIMYVKDGHTVFTRTIKAGFGTLFEYVNRDLEQPVSQETVELILNMSEEEYTLYVNPDKAKILAACTSGANRLFTQVARTLDYYSNHLKKARPEKLYLTGEVNLLKRFLPDLSDRLMLAVETLGPVMAGTDLSEEASASIEADGAERYVTAFGAALGPLGKAPNLICTHDIQARLSKIAQVRKLAAYACIGTAALLSIVFLSQLNQVQKHGAVLEKLTADASTKRLHISTDHAGLKVDEIRRKHEEAVILAERYKLLGALIEIQSLTPQGILIKNLTLKGDPKDRNGLILEGVVMGVNGSGASHLAKYVVDLNSSLMFSQVVIISQSELENDPLLRRKGALPFKIEGQFLAALDENQG